MQQLQLSVMSENAMSEQHSLILNSSLREHDVIPVCYCLIFLSELAILVDNFRI